MNKLTADILKNYCKKFKNDYKMVKESYMAMDELQRIVVINPMLKDYYHAE